MACNSYTLVFSVDEVVTFNDCNGNPQTLSGKSGIDYYVCSESTPTLPPSGVGISDNGPATNYFFSSCCGNYFFYACLADTFPLAALMTFGVEYLQFDDGLSTTNKCFLYDTTVTPPTGYTIPYVTAIQKNGFYSNVGDTCTTCNVVVPGSKCVPNYFRLCCCTYSTPNPPLSCYIAYIGKFTLSPGIYELTYLETSETVCAELVDPSTENFYSIEEYTSTTMDASFFSEVIDCDLCTVNYPCPTLTPTPTPTPSPTPPNTPTPTPTPSRTPNPTPSVKLINECEPITIYDMGISCVTIQPSSPTSNDGATSLAITGGTPPYQITWFNGSKGPAIINLSQGEYPVTVVDFYGDYTATTVCVLTGETTTTTSTTTTTTIPVPSGPILCMTASAEGPKYNFSLQQTFTVDSFINSKSSWVSNNGLYRIYYNISVTPNVWQLSGSTIPSALTIINQDQVNGPLGGLWQMLGAGPTDTISVSEGVCEIPFTLSPFSVPTPNITLFVVKNDTICGCEGSIMANANGGYSPYQYSIDNGLLYKNFPIFDNLCSGIYTVTVKDSEGFTKSTQITINPPKEPTNYLVNLTKTSSVSVNNGFVKTVNYESVLTVTPPLPPTTTITFDLIHTNQFQSSITEDTSYMDTNTVLYYNETPSMYTYSSTTTGSTINTIEGCQDKFVYITGTTEVWESITIGTNDTVSINTTTSVIKNFTNGCDIGNSSDNFQITNLKINGCNCCSVQNLTL